MVEIFYFETFAADSGTRKSGGRLPKFIRYGIGEGFRERRRISLRRDCPPLQSARFQFFVEIFSPLRFGRRSGAGSFLKSLYAA